MVVCIICNLIQYQLSNFVILNSMDHNLKDNCGKYLLFIAKLTFVFMNMYFVADHCIYKYVSMLSDNLMNKESVYCDWPIGNFLVGTGIGGY